MSRPIRYTIPTMTIPGQIRETVHHPLDDLSISFQDSVKSLSQIYLTYWRKLFCRWLFAAIKAIARGRPATIHVNVDRILMRTTTKTVEIDSESILQKVKLSQNELRQIFYGEVKHIACGSEEFHRLTGEVVKQYAQFHMPPVTFFQGRDVKYLGMSIVCVPWMKGLVLLPSLEDRPVPKPAFTDRGPSYLGMYSP